MLNSCVLNPKKVRWVHIAVIAHWMPRHQASKVHTHPSLALFTAFFPCSTKFAYCKWWLDAAETWQRGYELVSFVARYSFLHCRAGLDEARSDDAVHPGSLLRIRSGPLHGDSWTIQVPFLCNHPPSICGTWAVSAHGCLLGTISTSQKFGIAGLHCIFENHQWHFSGWLMENRMIKRREIFMKVWVIHWQFNFVYVIPIISKPH